MSEFIREIILVTRNSDGSPHIAPMGLREQDGLWLLAPFKPSRSLDNLVREGMASINSIDDVRVFAGCLSDRHGWPVAEGEQLDVLRLANANHHMEVRLQRMEDDEQRPRLYCRTEAERSHRPFLGYNRAQAAVVELAILVSRLHLLPMRRIESELAYLKIAMERTAGEGEWQAWQWLMERVTEHQERIRA